MATWSMENLVDCNKIFGLIKFRGQNFSQILLLGRLVEYFEKCVPHLSIESSPAKLSLEEIRTLQSWF